MDKYKETFETWNKVASLYQEKFMHLDLYNETYDLICNTIFKEKAKILDVGYGPGNISKYLLSKRPDYAILGIDIAPNMIELAKKNNPTADFLVMDSRNINEIQSKFDAIVCGFCLPYLSDLDCEKFLVDCYHLLHENGLIYLSFVEAESYKSEFKTSSTGDRVFFYFHNLNDLKNQLTATGFGNQIVFNVDFKRSESEVEMHTILIAGK